MVRLSEIQQFQIQVISEQLVPVKKCLKYLIEWKASYYKDNDNDNKTERSASK